MPRRISSIAEVLTVFVVVSLVAIGSTRAQQNNKPYTFKSSPGGNVGMSIGGRQAILNEKILGRAPRNLQRGADGRLLDVTEGPGHSAIARFEGNGGFIPGFYGSSFRGNNTFMQAGVFNEFFTPSSNGGISSGYGYAQYQATAIVNAWTMGVMSGNMPLSFYTSNGPVDYWTSAVFYNAGGH